MLREAIVTRAHVVAGRARRFAGGAQRFAGEAAHNTADVVNVFGGDLTRSRLRIPGEEHFERSPLLEDRLAVHAPRVAALWRNRHVVGEAAAIRDAHVVAGLAQPAWEGLIVQRGRNEDESDMPANYPAHFDWTLTSDGSRSRVLYDASRLAQWNATQGTDWDGKQVIDWATIVDPHNPERPILPDSLIPPSETKHWRQLSVHQREEQVHAYAAWILSQILHGEQGALIISSQLVGAMPRLDQKLMAASQVSDEARHVEVFDRYQKDKLGRLYPPNDNLFVVLRTDVAQSDYDMICLPMQIMIEGLAMSIFGLLRTKSQEPLLKSILKYVMIDEARHVQFGVDALTGFYQQTDFTAAQRRDREDWAYELALLLRNRFFADEIYEEFYAHVMTRDEWRAMILASPLMAQYRHRLFSGVMPNLRKVGLLSDRMRPHYERLGVLKYAAGKAATEMTSAEMLGEP